MRDRLSIVLFIAAACVLSQAASSRAAIVFDGPLGAPFYSGGKGTSTPAPLVRDDGFTVIATYTPQTADLFGTTVLAELGGTTNGFGLYLVDGKPTLVAKQNEGNTVITPPQHTTTLFGLEYPTALAPDATYEIVASYDPFDGRGIVAVDNVAVKSYGPKVSNYNWIGDNSFGAGVVGGGPGAGSGGNASPFATSAIKMIALDNLAATAWNAQPNAVNVMGSSVELDFGGPAPTPIYSGGDGTTTSGNLNSADGFTAVMNIVPSAADLTGSVVILENAGTTNGIGFYLVDGQVNMIAKTNAAGSNVVPDQFTANLMGVEHPTVLSAGQPYQIVGVFDPDADVAQLYVNGVLASVMRGVNTAGWNLTGDQSFGVGQVNGGPGGGDTTGGSPFNQNVIVSFSAGTATNLQVVAYNVGANSIPEPASASLALLGLAGLALRRRRRAA